MDKPRGFEWRTAIVVLGFLLSLAMVVIFTIRVLHSLPRPRSAEPIRPWMSVPYLAHAYHVPASALYQAIGLPGDHGDRRPIAVIARAQGRPVQELIRALDQAIRQAHPTVLPPTLPAPTPTGSAP